MVFVIYLTLFHPETKKQEMAKYHRELWGYICMGTKQDFYIDLSSAPIQWTGFLNVERLLKTIIPAILLFGIYPRTPREVDRKKQYLTM